MSPTRYPPRHARASKSGLLSFAFSSKSVAHDLVYSEITFTQKRGARVLHASPFSTCDTPRISCHPHPEGEPCITLYQMAVFPGNINSSLFRLAEGLFSCFLLRGPQGGGVDSTVQALAPAELRGPFSRWSKSRDPACNSGDGVRLPKSHPGA